MTFLMTHQETQKSLGVLLFVCMLYVQVKENNCEAQATSRTQQLMELLNKLKLKPSLFYIH